MSKENEEKNEEIMTGVELSCFKFPLSPETKKKIEEIQKSPELKCIIINELHSVLTAKYETEKEELAAFHKAQAYAKLIK